MEQNDYKQAVANKIKARLYELGLNRKQFAAMLNVSQSRITAYLNGRHNFTVQTLFEIEHVLNFNIFNYKQNNNMDINKLQILLHNDYKFTNDQIQKHMSNLAFHARNKDPESIEKENTKIDFLEEVKGYIDHIYANFPELKINNDASTATTKDIKPASA